jgi:ubiquinone/menaquinone biosynthesis C-methylase UbiE
MDIADIKQLNSLWGEIYPYLVSHIMESYQRDTGSVLELGPFSGGISLALARLYERLIITIADESLAVLNYLRKEISAGGLSERVTVIKTDLNHLPFEDSQFDLIIFRGVFFFLNEKENLLVEVFRVLKDRGMAFIGGGFGKGVPEELIDEISEESRELNDRLGRKRLSIERLQEIIKKSKFSHKCRIEEEGGLWLIINK